MRGLVRRLAVTGAAVGVAVFALAVPATAHVTVNPNEAVQGTYARLAFRVPTESDTASTTKLEVHLPENAPVASVSTMPVAGWAVATQKRKLATPIEVHGAPISEVVSVITWTAATPDAGIKPGQFLEFPVSFGPLPKVDTMVFKALQTYSDGNVVRWIEEPAADGKEVDSPAPVLKLVAAPSTTPAASVTVAEKADDTDAATWLGLAGLVAGVSGLILGGLALARSRGART